MYHVQCTIFIETLKQHTVRSMTKWPYDNGTLYMVNCK